MGGLIFLVFFLFSIGVIYPVAMIVVFLVRRLFGVKESFRSFMRDI